MTLSDLQGHAFIPPYLEWFWMWVCHRCLLLNVEVYYLIVDLFRASFMNECWILLNAFPASIEIRGALYFILWILFTDFCMLKHSWKPWISPIWSQWSFWYDVGFDLLLSVQNLYPHIYQGYWSLLLLLHPFLVWEWKQFCPWRMSWEVPIF